MVSLGQRIPVVVTSIESGTNLYSILKQVSTEQEELSLTFTQYLPVTKVSMVEEVAPLSHKKVYGAVPPTTESDIWPLLFEGAPVTLVMVGVTLGLLCSVNDTDNDNVAFCASVTVTE